jgi:acetyltransferase-like isoleucine patch superfamily enzyme
MTNIPELGTQSYLAQPPKICRGASIGAGAVILPGVTIYAGAMVAAGAVVTRDVMYGDLAIGVPARSQLHAGELHG